jgi:hypothetical protein
LKSASIGKRGSFPSLRKTQSSPDIGNDYEQFMVSELKPEELTQSYGSSNADANDLQPEVSKSEGTDVTVTFETGEKYVDNSIEKQKLRHKSEASGLKSQTSVPEIDNADEDKTISILHPSEERKFRHSPFIDVETKQEVTAEKTPETTTDSGGELSDIHTRELADEVTDLQTVVMRRNKPRGHTIAVIPSAKERSRSDSEENRRVSMHMKEMYRTGLTPSFVFLMLYHSPGCGSGEERPLVLPQTPVSILPLTLHLICVFV